MKRRLFAATLMLVACAVVPSSVAALTGPGGCSGLPEYYRAQGALQGMTSACNMSLAEAHRIVARYDGPSAATVEPPVPAPVRHRRHRVRGVE